MKYVEIPLHIDIKDALEDRLPSSWIVHHSPNGGLRSKREGALFKAMGTKAGFPDLLVLGQVLGRPAAWFLEVKTPKGPLSDSQKDFFPKLNALGLPLAVVRSVDDALEIGREWGWPNCTAITLHAAEQHRRENDGPISSLDKRARAKGHSALPVRR